jgi:hypothetical protein
MSQINKSVVMKKLLKLLCLSFLLFPLKNYSQNSRPVPAKGEEQFMNKPKLVRGPYLQVATDTSIVVRWRTDVLSRSCVRYGSGVNELDSTRVDLSLNTEHEIKITGLQPGTKYYYSIGSLKDTLQYGSDNYFSTLPVPGKEGLYRIGVFGDCGYLSVNQANVRDQFINYLGKNDLNAWILLGDNAYNDGNDMEYQEKFFKPYQETLLKRYPVYPAPGNHDYHDADFGARHAQMTHNTAYYRNFSMPVNGEAGGLPSGNPAFYSFDLGNIHFISLDSYGMEENNYFLYDSMGPQYQWLKKDLEANRNKGWVIAYWHHPPYSKGTHDSDTDDMMSGIRENILKLLDSNEVDLVLCGHSHVYERSGLMKGYYGKSTDFDSVLYNVRNSTGLNNRSANSALYTKERGANKGIVYVVSGSAAYVSKSRYGLNHPAMVYSNDSIAGAAILEIEENRLDFKWIGSDGIIRDQFTMMKDVGRNTELTIRKGEPITLKASFVGYYKWSNHSITRSNTVRPLKTTTYFVTDPANNITDQFKVVVTK